MLNFQAVGMKAEENKGNFVKWPAFEDTKLTGHFLRRVF